MHFVPKLDRFSQDLMLPGNVHDNDGWVHNGTIDLQANQNAARAVSIKFMREAARRIPEVGLVERSELELAIQRAEDAERLLAESNRALETAEAKLDRIQGLARDGFRVQRQLGRPPVKKEAHA